MRPEGVVEGEVLLFEHLAALRTKIGWVGRIGNKEFGSLGNWVHLDEAFCASCDLYSTNQQVSVRIDMVAYLLVGSP